MITMFHQHFLLLRLVLVLWLRLGLGCDNIIPLDQPPLEYVGPQAVICNVYYVYLLSKSYCTSVLVVVCKTLEKRHDEGASSKVKL